MEEVSGSAGASAPATVECPFCAEQIIAHAKKCRHCGETVDVALRRAEEALRASERQGGNVYMNAAVSAPVSNRPYKSRGTAIILALLLGGIGIHKFYLGRPGWGLLYLIFAWTFIPAAVAFVEFLIYAFSNEENFHLKYG